MFRFTFPPSSHLRGWGALSPLTCWSSAYTLEIIFTEGLQFLWLCYHVYYHFDLGAPSFVSFLSRGSNVLWLFFDSYSNFFRLWSTIECLHIGNDFYRGAPSFLALRSCWKAFLSRSYKFCVISIDGLHVLWPFFGRLQNSLMTLKRVSSGTSFES